MTSSNRFWRRRPASTICYNVFDLPKLEKELAVFGEGLQRPLILG